MEAHNHRVNAAEPAAKTEKYQIIAHIATLDHQCPIQLWSKLLPQMQYTLNMLRISRNNNKLTAYEELNGKFDWNRTPIAPLGTIGMLFIHPESHTTFAPHCDEAFTVGRARHHYRLLELYVPTTRGYRISGNLRLDPTHWKLPSISEQDKTVVVATELLEQHKKFTPPSAIHKMKQIDIIKKLQAILYENLQQRVEKAQETRVENTPPQRVNTATPQRVDT